MNNQHTLWRGINGRGHLFAHKAKSAGVQGAREPNLYVWSGEKMFKQDPNWKYMFKQGQTNPTPDLPPLSDILQYKSVRYGVPIALGTLAILMASPKIFDKISKLAMLTALVGVGLISYPYIRQTYPYIRRGASLLKEDITNALKGIEKYVNNNNM